MIDLEGIILVNVRPHQSPKAKLDYSLHLAIHSNLKSKDLAGNLHHEMPNSNEVLEPEQRSLSGWFHRNWLSEKEM
jgi:hypothetical protein